MTVTVTAPKDYTTFRRCLRDLGYTARRGKHEVWSKDGEENFILPLTPSDWRGFQNDLARLKRRHPEVFPEVHKSEHRPTKDQRRARSRRRSSRPSLALALTGPAAPERPPVALEPEHPAPGSSEALAAGCVCPRFENRHGLGVEGQDGIFAQVKHCELHGWEDEPATVIAAPAPTPPAPTGFDKYERRGRGRPPGTGRSPGCAQCGDTSAGRVTVLLEDHPKHTRITSHALTFCEPCAVAAFDRLIGALSTYEHRTKEAA